MFGGQRSVPKCLAPAIGWGFVFWVHICANLTERFPTALGWDVRGTIDRIEAHGGKHPPVARTDQSFWVPADVQISGVA